MQLINHYEVKEFHYNSKEERDNHENEMIKNGWNCSGQIRKNIGDFINPEYIWYACYCKYYK